MNLRLLLVGAAPGARADKLRAESYVAAQYQVRSLFGRAAPPHNTTGTQRATRLSLANRSKKRTRPPPDARCKRVDEAAACRRELVLYLHNYHNGAVRHDAVPPRTRCPRPYNSRPRRSGTRRTRVTSREARHVDGRVVSLFSISDNSIFHGTFVVRWMAKT